MKHLKIAGLCLATTLALSVVIATTASAAPVWEQCSTEKAATAATKYTEDLCNKASGSGWWAWQEIPASAPQTIHVRGTVTLKDAKTLAGESEVECLVEAEGPAGGSVEKAEKVTATNCRGVKVCEGTPTVSAVDLPWETEFFETEKKVLQTLKGTTNGEPGWNIKCKVSGVEVEDECKGEKGSPERLADENVETNGVPLLLETFTGSAKGDCKQGGKETGSAKGSIGHLVKVGGLQVS